VTASRPPQTLRETLYSTAPFRARGGLDIDLEQQGRTRMGRTSRNELEPGRGGPLRRPWRAWAPPSQRREIPPPGGRAHDGGARSPGGSCRHDARSPTRTRSPPPAAAARPSWLAAAAGAPLGASAGRPAAAAGGDWAARQGCTGRSSPRGPRRPAGRRPRPAALRCLPRLACPGGSPRGRAGGSRGTWSRTCRCPS